MSSRRSVLLCVTLGGLIFVWLGWWYHSSQQQARETPPATIDRRPVSFANRTFDPASPPADMPPLAAGEQAACDSNFLSNTSVGGQTQQTDATHALVTITQINVTLQLNITIWAPANVTAHVIEHEEGHRQIAEYYYRTAGELAQRIASTYMGEKVEVQGTDLSAESTKLFEQVATEITDEYSKELNPGPTQLLYDGITDHGRNEVIVKDAVASAINNAAVTSPQPATHPGN